MKIICTTCNKEIGYSADHLGRHVYGDYWHDIDCPLDNAEIIQQVIRALVNTMVEESKNKGGFIYER